MKLFYTRGDCSMAVLILLEEMGIVFQSEERFLSSDQINAPLLELEHGEVLYDCPNVLQYLVEKDHRIDLIGGAPGTLEKYRCLEWLNVFRDDIHNSLELLQRNDVPETLRGDILAKIEKRLTYMNESLIGKSYLLGDHLTIADIYAIVNLHELDLQKFNLKWFPRIIKYMAFMNTYPAVIRSGLFSNRSISELPPLSWTKNYEKIIELEDYGPTS